ncbi:MAG: hypothetical protein Q7S10_01915 [bacterium]|nr:hypothetical protein [bacterium]
MKKIHKYLFLVVIAAGLASYSSLVFAEDSTVQPSQNVRATAMEAREAVKNRIEAQKEKIKEAREAAQAKAKELKEKAKNRIEEIKDKKKKETAEKIASQFERINKIWTDHFTNVLDRLDAILQKIKSRTQKAGENGKDVTLVNAAITNAEAKIAQARSAVALQAQKTYVLNTSATDPTSTTQEALVTSLREQFKVLKKQLHTDLAALRDGAMKSAREAVKSTFEALSNIPGVDNE